MQQKNAVTGTAVFLILVPGTVAGLIPWLISDWVIQPPIENWWPVRVLGLVLIAAGIAVLLQAFLRFVVDGGGTPAPVAAPTRLVIQGPFRYVRNPMYVAVVAIILGQGFVLWDPSLFVYGAVVWGCFELFVVAYEQPTLRGRFGINYQEYCRNVRAWVPRLRPWTPTPLS